MAWNPRVYPPLGSRAFEVAMLDDRVAPAKNRQYADRILARVEKLQAKPKPPSRPCPLVAAAVVKTCPSGPRCASECPGILTRAKLSVSRGRR